MGSPLKWEIDDSGDILRIKMYGSMTEQVVFTEILERPEERVSLDLSEVRRFTSAGIREWVNFIIPLSAKREVLLECCSTAMVHQLSMIANMAGHARIKSIMLPYQCPDCDSDQEEVLEIDPEVPPEIVEEVTCSECGEMSEFDDLPESYLAFVLHPVEAEDGDDL